MTTFHKVERLVRIRSERIRKAIESCKCEVMIVGNTVDFVVSTAYFEIATGLLGADIVAVSVP